MKSIWYLLVIIYCIVTPMCAFAEQVEHHGVMVNADGRARDCINCHDGSRAHIVVYCTVQCDFSTAHSLFKHYPPRKDRGKYASAAAVAAKGIKLLNGKITCISCHDLRNPDKDHLVGSNSKKNLCLICHITK